MTHNTFIDLKVLRKVFEEQRACVFPQTRGNGSESLENGLQLLQAREVLLLKQTLTYANTNVPYYENLFDQIGFNVDNFQTVADLCQLPVLTKSVIASNLENFLSRRANVTSIVCTSGTTGHRLPRFLSEEEEEACALLNKIDSACVGTSKNQKDILLRIVPAMRRYLRVRQSADVLQITATLNWDYPRYYTRCDFYDFVIKQLFESFPVPGTAGYVTIVHVTPPFLIRMLVEEMKSRSLAFTDTHVHSIVCSGGLLTNRLRALIEKDWGAKAYSSYSMTEVNAAAIECRLHPFRYHFNGAVYLEVVDPVTHLPVPEGHEGLLLVTSLYPFQQAQPVIRYDTGDLVVQRGKQCECGTIAPSVEFRGRLQQCLDLTDIVPGFMKKRYVGSADIQDLLEDIPEVPSLFYPRFNLGRTYRDDGSVAICLETEVAHLTDTAMEEKLKKRILTALQSRYPDWNALIEQGKMSWNVKLCNRGDMESFIRLTPPS